MRFSKKALLSIFTCGLLACLGGCEKVEKACDLFSACRDLDTEHIIPIAVIGSGPAGLAAALYGARLGPRTVVFSGPEPGGQLTRTSEVENWSGVPPAKGLEIMEANEKQVRDSGATIVNSTVESVDFSRWPYELMLDDDTVVHALTVIIATGAHPRMLNIPGEQEFWGNGVSGCAVCDAPFFKGKSVVVIGGGDSAAEQATQLATHAASVTMFVRGSTMRASASMKKRLDDYENITVVYDTVVTEIQGDTEVSSVVLHNRNTEKNSVFKTDGVFVAIGHEPNTAIFKDQLDLDRLGYIKTKCPTQHTSVKGVYAAGDVDDYRYQQAGTAAGEGIKAGMDAYHFLSELGYSPSFEKSIEERLFEPVDRNVQELDVIRSAEEYRTLLAEDAELIILDFYTQGCIACKQLEPMLEQLAAEYSARVAIAKIDAAEYPEIAEQYTISGVPALVFIKNGAVVHVLQTEQDLKKAALSSRIEGLL